MSIEQEEYQTKPRNGKIVAGVILLGVGAILLLQQISSYMFPDWLISWPMFVVAWGFYSGAKHDFKKPGWIFIVLIGTLWLLKDVFPGADLGRFMFPLIIISVGFYIIVGRNRRWDREHWGQKFHTETKTNFDQAYFGETKEPIAGDFGGNVPPSQPYSDDYLDSVSVFGGVKKTILSKNFKGGEIVNIFGGAELDLTQADINGRVIIDLTQVFGGTKLVVPPHWQVVSDLAAIFSGHDDKRRPGTIPLSTDKILVIKGVSLFAGVDIRSY